MFFKKKEVSPTVSFALCCWENDWKYILQEKDYLKAKHIGNNLYDFASKVLVINNVNDHKKVLFFAKKKIDEGVLSHVYLARDFEEEVLSFFNLKREDFRPYKEEDRSWVFYNGIGVLTSIYLCKTDYLLYHTGDAFLENPVNWIPSAIKLMERKRKYKVANLCWNNDLEEVERESYKVDKDFFVSKRGFSDQQFLVKAEDFRKPIYNEIRKDSYHYPRGDIFEKRVFSFMKNHGWKRITYRNGSYIHKNIEQER